MHLVCTSKYTKNLQQPHPVLQTPSPTNLSNEANVTNTPLQTEVPSPNPTAEQNIPNVQPNMPWIYNVNGTPVDANQYAMQVVWMQQAYLQYMTQYMQL